MSGLSAKVFRFRVPLRAPLRLASGLLTDRTGFLLRISDAAGHVAWGEASPLPGFSAESEDEARAALLACARRIGEGSGDQADPGARTRAVCGDTCPDSVYFAVESALTALCAMERSVTMASVLAPGSAPCVRLNALLAGSDAAILARARELPAAGYTCAKLKVGMNTPAHDVALVRAVREALGPAIALRLDANRAWPLEDAVAYAGEAAESGIVYIEEPVRDWRDLHAFAARSPIPYALDETLCARAEQETDLEPLFENAAAFVFKPTIAHGPGLLKRLQAYGRPIVISAAFESGVGLRALAHYGAAISGPDTPIGLDTYRWLGVDVLDRALPIEGAELHLPDIDAALVAEDRLEPLGHG